MVFRLKARLDESRIIIKLKPDSDVDEEGNAAPTLFVR
jgi:hypothetical protein